MGKDEDYEPRAPELRSFADSRTIDVADAQAMAFWSEHLGVPPEEIAETVKDVGPNATAVALKLEAPHKDNVAPPAIAPR